MTTEPAAPKKVAKALGVSSLVNERVDNAMISGLWYVVQTLPHAEARAIFHLQRQGYRVFCPRVPKIVRHARKVTRCLTPLFPGYVFLHLNLSHEPWRSVNGTCGVVRLITQGEAPQAIPAGVVEILQARDGGEVLADLRPAFEIGQAVRISRGPLAEFVGVLEHLDAAGRVRVLLTLLGRSVAVMTRCESLAAAA